MRKVFGIENFRLAQEGFCNANMDGRDAICIMPTGGGKSLTYQLPATLMPGCTLVISPLVSLMKDQMLHLQENRIEGLMFTASMSNAEKVEAYDRLNATAMGNDPAREVKLCYVTPERIGKSKKFMSVVGTMVTAKKLARIVIDEAHCVSQLGHDYRPDYKQLASLRMLYPHVPILALSATCPPVVLRDLIATLRLPPLTDGRGAASHGTVLFTSPLYRKNLHYKVLPKPPGSARLMRDMVKYILEHHPNQSGIVYCLSRADSERVAADLDSVSQGRIKTGVYHAEINDKAKEELHESWRRGRVKVVCATIAFGLGIDKADVRFVLHHSKSVETFYQESGRAGRDGRDADCIMYYRLQDALRTPGILSDPDWQRQVHGMAKFCLDLQGCRKLEYFSSFDSTWAEDNSRCGHCDNCTRDPASVVQSDVTLDAKRVLAVARILHSRKIKVTAAQLALTTRGAGPQSKLLQLAPGDKVTLSPLDTETLMAHMLLEGYLEKSYTPTAYRVQVYIKPGARARRL
ncbi:P-loop containing nucleoside triphosphate hydrolase protein, partial [Multifurca ochricompacta]